MGSTYTIFMFVLLFVMMYFFMIRPQRKQQQQHQEMMNNLKKGDEVVTIGRLHGVIDSINTEDKTVTLDCDGVYLVLISMQLVEFFHLLQLLRQKKKSLLMKIRKQQLKKITVLKKKAKM